VSDERTAILGVAAGLALVTAAVHLYLGTVGVVTWSNTGDLPTVLTPLFLAFGLAVLGGMALVHRRPSVLRPVYGLGAVLMALALVGYADWHVLGVVESTLGVEDLGHDHGNGASHDEGHGHDHGHDDGEPVGTLIDHLATDALALVSKSAELGLLVVLTVLFWGSRGE